MSPVKVITVLLPLVTFVAILLPLFTTATAQQLAKGEVRKIDIPKRYLDDIYFNCQVATPNRFCMAIDPTSDKPTPFFEGQGCFRKKNCEAFVYGRQLDKPDAEGHSMIWELVVPKVNPDKDEMFFFVTNNPDAGMFYNTSSSKFYVKPNVVLMGSGDDSEVAYDDKGNLVTIQEPNKKTTFVFKSFYDVQETDKKIYLFYAPAILEYPPVNYKHDVVEEELFPVIVKKGGVPPSIKNYVWSVAMKLFKRDGTPTRPSMATTLPPSTEKTNPPATAAAISVGRSLALLAIAATFALLY